MNILILGASGFLGNACYVFFSGKERVTGVDIRETGHKDIFIDHDLSVTRELIRKERFDVIVNCAGSANIKASFLFPEKDYFSNTVYVDKILNLIAEFSPETKFVQISSAAVYGDPEKLPVRENSPTRPLSPYGENKLKSEALLKQYYRSHKVPGLSLRIFSAYGAGLRQQFFYDLYRKFKNDSHQVTLFGTGNESRDFIYVSDIVLAVNALIHRADFKGEVYNLASGKETFIKEAALLFAKITGYNGEILFTNEQLEGYPINWCADISEIKKFDFIPGIELKEGLSLYHNWLKNNPV